MNLLVLFSGKENGESPCYLKSFAENAVVADHQKVPDPLWNDKQNPFELNAESKETTYMYKTHVKEVVLAFN